MELKQSFYPTIEFPSGKRVVLNDSPFAAKSKIHAFNQAQAIADTLWRDARVVDIHVVPVVQIESIDNGELSDRATIDDQ
ncbi:hypothetical protein GT360_08085 [Vibrio astriarenae]|uniref:Uncharacterized protein n=1 Tax=Vibrio astriarenae TaxID=1481923 RepID=A0A7Z2T334_9VIBR|nr:hypothetical protein [Vibrio astriarenae]QIA63478.1 hypothetical protein GT360_08085 [Vibrio astriarenae]